MENNAEFAISFIWESIGNVEESIDKFLEYHKENLMVIAKNWPEIKTVQGLIERHMTMIKELELITKGSLKHMFEANLNIVYNIEKNLH